jgi:hypothetical protein
MHAWYGLRKRCPERRVKGTASVKNFTKNSCAMKRLIFESQISRPGAVVHIYNPSYSVGRDRRIMV